MAENLLSSVLACFRPHSKTRNSSPAPETSVYGTFAEKYTDNTPFPKIVYQYVDDNDSTEAAESVLSALLTASTDLRNSPTALADLDDKIHACGGWSESLAKAILSGIEKAIESGVDVGKAMQRAMEKAKNAAIRFAKEHPVYATLIAIGILCEMAPWVLGWLGFAETGIVEGSWAALWQARYAGYVPRGSLFSFFQSMGMRWRWKIL